MILLKNIDQVEKKNFNIKLNNSFVFLNLAKAKLESQLELTRIQEATNGGQANDNTKRV